MKKKEKTKQIILQVSFGICLILFAVLIEFVAIHPPGIYYYSKDRYKEFFMGDSKEQVLKKINKRKTIRIIKACGPDAVFELKSRKLFEMDEYLKASNYWICNDRTGKDFLFLFREGSLEKVLLQRLRFQKKNGSILFSQCSSEVLKDVDAYLTDMETLKIFYDTDSGIQNEN
jgi:hypothetical protein